MATRAGKKSKTIPTTLGKAPQHLITEKPVDLGVVGKPIHTSLFGLQEILKMFQTGSSEVKAYARYECDILYECRVCRNLFRSFANFVLHKRNYCRDSFNAHDHIRKDRDANNFEIICAELQETSGEAVSQTLEKDSEESQSNSKKSLSNTLKKLSSKHESEEITHFALTEDFSNETKSYEDNEKRNAFMIETIPNNEAGVFQTFFNKDSEDGVELMRNEVMELHGLIDNAEAVLTPTGQIDALKTKQLNEKPIIPDCNLVCSICNQRFSTKKTLTYHIKYKHNGSRIVYPCPACKDTFANPWCVFRHLYKVHRKTTAQIKRLREQIHSSGIKREEEPVKKKPKDRCLIGLSKSNIIQENQQWIIDFEGSNDLQMCGGCGKRFERKAALHSHSQICLKRHAAYNNLKDTSKKAEEKEVDTARTEQKEQSPKNSRRKPRNPQKAVQVLEDEEKVVMDESSNDKSYVSEKDSSELKPERRDSEASSDKDEKSREYNFESDSEFETNVIKEIDISNISIDEIIGIKRKNVNEEMDKPKTDVEENEIVENREEDSRPDLEFVEIQEDETIKSVIIDEEIDEARFEEESSSDFINCSPGDEIKSEDTYGRIKIIDFSKDGTFFETDKNHEFLLPSKEEVKVEVINKEEINIEKEEVISVGGDEEELKVFEAEDNESCDEEIIANINKSVPTSPCLIKNLGNCAPEDTLIDDICNSSDRSEPESVFNILCEEEKPEYSESFKKLITDENQENSSSAEIELNLQNEEVSPSSYKRVNLKFLKGNNCILSTKRKADETELNIKAKIAKTEPEITLEMKASKYMDLNKNLCIPCNIKFVLHEQLLKHMSFHFRWFLYQCSKCLFMSYDKTTCMTHAKKQHHSITMENIVLPIPNWKTVNISTEFRNLKFQVYNPSGVVFYPENEIKSKVIMINTPKKTSPDSSEPSTSAENTQNEIIPPMKKEKMRKMIMEVIFGSKDKESKPAKPTPGPRPIRNRSKNVSADFVYDMKQILRSKLKDDPPKKTARSADFVKPLNEPVKPLKTYEKKKKISVEVKSNQDDCCDSTAPNLIY